LVVQIEQPPPSSSPAPMLTVRVQSIFNDGFSLVIFILTFIYGLGLI
jgi:hypothetical protein